MRLSVFGFDARWITDLILLVERTYCIRYLQRDDACASARQARLFEGLASAGRINCDQLWPAKIGLNLGKAGPP